MAQFSIYRNRNAQTRARFPFLLDIQSGLLASLATRVVVPLSPAGSTRARSLQTLTPTISIEGDACLVVTPQLAGVAASGLGPLAADASADRHTIVAALDLLLAGV